jgi:hypothetical protein
VQIELAKTVSPPPADVFAVVGNVLEWPRIIRSIKKVELLTPGPLRTGSRLRAERIMFGRSGMHRLEIADLDRPHRLRMLVEHPDLHYELDHVVDAVYGAGCRIMLIFRSRSATSAGQALQPLMTPFMEITLRDELEQDLSDLAAAVPHRVS